MGQRAACCRRSRDCRRSIENTDSPESAELFLRRKNHTPPEWCRLLRLSVVALPHCPCDWWTAWHSVSQYPARVLSVPFDPAIAFFQIHACRLIEVRKADLTVTVSIHGRLQVQGFSRVFPFCLHLLYRRNGAISWYHVAFFLFSGH